MSEDAPGSWWTTLPGMLTAAAALLTAVTGLVVALNQMGMIGQRGEPGSSSASRASVTSTPRSRGDTPAPSSSHSPEQEAESEQSTEPQQGNQTFTSTLPLNRPIRLGDVSYEILRSTMELEGDAQLAIRLTVRMTCDRDYDANFWDQSFRIAVGEDVYPASGRLNEVVEAHSTKRGEVLILVPDSVRRAELRLLYQGTNKTLPFTIRAHGA